VTDDDSRTTRRRFLQAAGTSAAALSVPAGAVARPADRPNVVVIVIDTLRADHAYGTRARTPNMDALARDGVRFVRTHPEAMPTIPARNSLLSGRRVFPFRGWHDYRGLLERPGWAPLDDVGGAFTSVLRRAGYWTGYATDNPFLGFAPPYARLRDSFDRFARRGGQLGGRKDGVSERELRHWLHPAMEDARSRQRVRQYLANGGYAHDETRSFAARVFRDGVRLLEAGARQRPFALVVDTFQPHEPWTPPRKYLDMYGDPDYRGPEPGMPRYATVGSYLAGPGRERLLRRMRALYAAEVTMTDRWLGVLLDRLHDLRLERETAIVLVSDHGFLLGEHGYTGKKAERLHPEMARVPLTIVHPEHRRAGTDSSYLASTHDVAPTVLSMAGVRTPRPMTGVDLSSVFRGRRPPERTYAYGGYENSFYIRTDRWALLGVNAGTGFQLYDVRRDPGETRNLASVYPAKVEELYGVVLRRAGGRLPYYP
jgi:arylsulfatase A-like enzyme